MKIILYKNSSEDNRLDKTSFLTQIIEIDGTLKEETSITSPSVMIQILTGDSILEANYLYIQEFNRYYFINDIKSVRNQLWRLECSVDVLMSFKDIILQQQCIIGRQQYDYNFDLPDSLIPLEKEKTIEYVEFTNDIFKINEITAYQYVITFTGEGY